MERYADVVRTLNTIDILTAFPFVALLNSDETNVVT